MQADGTGEVDLTGPDGSQAPDWQNLPAPTTAAQSSQ
jgi:hypothetical protein